MSICYKSECCTLIDHCQYISNLYQKVFANNNERFDQIKSFKLSANIFSIKRIRKEFKYRKRKIVPCDVSKETEMIQQMYNKFKLDIAKVEFDIYMKYDLIETREVRDLAAMLNDTTTFELNGVNGGNNSDVALKCKIKDNYFLLPPKSRFYCGSVKEQCSKLAGNTYSILVADPPWWNKYIRRLKDAAQNLSYSMMYNEDIAAIPVTELLASNALVAVWCTNAASNITAVKELILPRWGVEYLTTWYWLKLTVDLELLCEFGLGCQKQPYERVIIGKVGEVKDVPQNLMFASIPSAIHSHKPPLLDLLTPYVNCDNPQSLELFARYLLPNTTSVGYEPLKLQHISLFDDTSEFNSE